LSYVPVRGGRRDYPAAFDLQATTRQAVAAGRRGAAWRRRHRAGRRALRMVARQPRHCAMRSSPAGDGAVKKAAVGLTPPTAAATLRSLISRRAPQTSRARSARRFAPEK